MLTVNIAPKVKFGAGVGYRIWKELWLGMDTRYHLASNQTNSVNNAD